MTHLGLLCEDAGEGSSSKRARCLENWDDWKEWRAEDDLEKSFGLRVDLLVLFKSCFPNIILQQ